MLNKNNYFCKPLQLLIDQKRLPMLFIGSGLSKRYLQGYPSWDQLIMSLASDVNINEEQILAIKQEITDRFPNCAQSEVYKVVATKITEKLRRDVADGLIELGSLFSNEEIKQIKRENIPFAKMLIAKKFNNYTLKDSVQIKNEIEELKKLQNNIGVVLTTNYDTFLEKVIFNNFTCFYEQSQYYMNENEGIGEIYKIHGSVTNPKTLIFNSDDYDNFESNLKVIVAKMLTLLLDYPLVFFGYSLEDENIQNILCTLIDCIDSKQLETLSNRLIYVTWKENENRLLVSKKYIKKDGKTLTLTNIETDNFSAIYKYLQKFYPYEKPERVRKLKRMIRDLVYKSTAGANTILTTEENLDKLNAENNLVIAFGGSETLAERGLIGLKAVDLCKIVLNQKQYSSNYCEKIIEQCYINNTQIAQGHFVPMFYFTKNTNKFDNNDKLRQLKINILQYVNRIVADTNIPTLQNNENVLLDLKNQQKSKLISVLIKSYATNVINYKDYLQALNLLISDTSLDYTINSTGIRQALTYADVK